MPKLIITNGDAAAARIRAAGLKGHLVPWQDMLHDGPVPADADLDRVSDVRAEFLAEALGMELDAVRADFAHRDAQIEVHGAYGEVELWFEHDLYDQLQLIQILNYFSDQPERMGLFLLQASHYLGVMEPSAVSALAEARAPLSQVQMETARQAWEAFTAPTPSALAGFAHARHDSLPHLVPALRRLLAEFPAPRSGLSLTEERILRQLADGPAKVAKVFAAVHSMDEAQFLADLPFFLRLDGLAFAHEPLIEGLPFRTSDCGPLAVTPGETGAGETAYRAYAGAEIALTKAGAAALAGRFDHASENQVERAIGGTRIGPGAMWRYERASGDLVAPN
ncbi:DUF1835 domain-containing protein [Xanthobacter sp. KR7-225]|uniref:DUF1835 domain-containing protein n=1 Tax=Xanthobacter sp. KR7-225 TaxID=3156613 RepID=UPI0032B48864